jgi:hypothetical protein
MYGRTLLLSIDLQRTNRISRFLLNTIHSTCDIVRGMSGIARSHKVIVRLSMTLTQ